MISVTFLYRAADLFVGLLFGYLRNMHRDARNGEKLGAKEEPVPIENPKCIGWGTSGSSLKTVTK